MPSSNREYWERKFKRNRERDRENYEDLHEEGWNVLIVWGCELKSAKDRIGRTERLAREIRSEEFS